jgi:hypothetical protein
MKIDDVAKRLEALGNPTRLKITERWCVPASPVWLSDACKRS